MREEIQELLWVHFQNGEIKNCKNNVKITANKSDSIGGIAGTIKKSAKISYCINYASISANNFAGGIVRI